MIKKNHTQLTSDVKEIATLYFYYQYKLKHSHGLGSTNYEEYQQTVDRIDLAFSYLEEDEKDIINNEFFYQSSPDWWELTYSKAEFNRKKDLAMSKFINYFVSGGMAC
ncbi:MAG: hypothetical protein LUD22_00660 [Coprobacillus sp.]|nr:hypothetical protein [Coprobacillus sp.]